MQKLIIIGLSKTANHVYSFVTDHKLYEVIGYAVNEEYKTTNVYNNLPVYSLEHLEEEIGHNNFFIFVAMLWNHLNRDRKNVYDYCKNKGYKMANLISPLASVHSKIIGDNCWIHDFVVIQQNSTIQSDVAIMAGSLIGANTNVGAHCFFGAHSLLGGGSTIGQQCFVGINSIIFDDTHIGNKCIIGACTAVKRNMPDFSKYSTTSDNIIIKQYSEDVIEDKLVFSKNVR